jgi:DNA-binding SARP family transcriptional activator
MTTPAKRGNGTPSLVPGGTQSSPPPTSGRHLSLLGGFELRLPDGSRHVPHSSQRVLAFLALHDRELLRSFVSGHLWPETSEARASGSLRSALWRVRRVDSELIQATDGRLGLGPEVNVDVRIVEAAARHILTATGHAQSTLDPSSFATDILPGWYDEWLFTPRERMLQLNLHALEAAAEQHLAAGDYVNAMEWAITAASVDPFRESPQRILARIHLAEGNQSEALRTYVAYRNLLKTEFEQPPTLEFQAIISQIRQEDRTATGVSTRLMAGTRRPAVSAQ